MIVASLLLIILMPVFAIIAVFITISSPGPVFFRQRRLGYGGKQFWCLKFRTMVTDAEEVLRRSEALQRAFREDFKIKDDPRVTRIGRVLRRTSLDELPQLFNVLCGDMSLIGPRPIVPDELEKYGAYGAKLLTVPPGLGGAWQVCGRSDVSYAERVALDMAYIDSRSLVTDLSLLVRTAASVLRRQGAY